MIKPLRASRLAPCSLALCLVGAATLPVLAQGGAPSSPSSPAGPDLRRLLADRRCDAAGSLGTDPLRAFQRLSKTRRPPRWRVLIRPGTPWPKALKTVEPVGGGETYAQVFDRLALALAMKWEVQDAMVWFYDPKHPDPLAGKAGEPKVDGRTLRSLRAAAYLGHGFADAALRVLVKDPRSLPILERALEVPDTSLRMLVSRHMPKLGPKAGPALARLVELQPKGYQRDTARRALIETGKGAVPFLKAELAKAAPSDEPRLVRDLLGTVSAEGVSAALAHVLAEGTSARWLSAEKARKAAADERARGKGPNRLPPLQGMGGPALDGDSLVRSALLVGWTRARKPQSPVFAPIAEHLLDLLGYRELRQLGLMGGPGFAVLRKALPRSKDARMREQIVDELLREAPISAASSEAICAAVRASSARERRSLVGRISSRSTSAHGRKVQPGALAVVLDLLKAGPDDVRAPIFLSYYGDLPKPVLEHALLALASSDRELRRAASRAILALRSKPAPELLEVASKGIASTPKERREVSAAYAHVLSRFGQDGLDPLLERLAQTTSENWNYAIERACAEAVKLAGATAEPSLRKLLTTSTGRAQVCAAGLLARMGKEAAPAAGALESVLTGATSPEASRQAAARALIAIGEAGEAKLLAQLDPAATPIARAAALRVVGTAPTLARKATKPLLQLVESGAADEQLHCLNAIRVAQIDAAAPVLIRLLPSAPRQVVTAIVYTLGFLAGHEEATTKALIPLLADRSVSGAACRAIAKQGTSAHLALDELRQLAEEPKGRHRVEALEAVRAAGSKGGAARAWLGPLLGEEHPGVRLAALEASVAVAATPKDAFELARSGIGDANTSVHHRAFAAVVSLVEAHPPARDEVLKALEDPKHSSSFMSLDMRARLPLLLLYDAEQDAAKRTRLRDLVFRSRLAKQDLPQLIALLPRLKQPWTKTVALELMRSHPTTPGGPLRAFLKELLAHPDTRTAETAYRELVRAKALTRDEQLELLARPHSPVKREVLRTLMTGAFVDGKRVEPVPISTKLLVSCLSDNRASSAAFYELRRRLGKGIAIAELAPALSQELTTTLAAYEAAEPKSSEQRSVRDRLHRVIQLLEACGAAAAPAVDALVRCLDHHDLRPDQALRQLGDATAPKLWPRLVDPKTDRRTLERLLRLLDRPSDFVLERVLALVEVAAKRPADSRRVFSMVQRQLQPHESLPNDAEPEPVIFKLLSHTNSGARSAGVSICQRWARDRSWQNKHLVPWAKSLLDHPERDHREAGVFLARALKADANPLAPKLIELSADPRSPGAAQSALSELGSGALPALLEGIKSEDAAQAKVSVRVLGWILRAHARRRPVAPSIPKAIASLVEIAKDNDHRFRREAVLALGAAGPIAEPSAGPVLESAFDQLQGNLRYECGMALVSLGGPSLDRLSKKLIANLQTGTIDAKVLALTLMGRGLAKARGERAEAWKREILAALGDADASVRERASRALVGVPGVSPALRQRFAVEKDPKVLEGLAMALSSSVALDKAEQAATAKTFTDGLSNPSARVRRTCASALANCREHAALALAKLRELAESDPDKYVARIAKRTIRWIERQQRRAPREER